MPHFPVSIGTCVPWNLTFRQGPIWSYVNPASFVVSGPCYSIIVVCFGNSILYIYIINWDVTEGHVSNGTQCVSTVNLSHTAQGTLLKYCSFSLQGILGNQSGVNMAAVVGRLLSFSKNAKVLVSPLRLSAVPAQRYSLEVSTTGEVITHTGQVSARLPASRIVLNS